MVGLGLLVVAAVSAAVGCFHTPMSLGFLAIAPDYTWLRGKPALPVVMKLYAVINIYA